MQKNHKAILLTSQNGYYAMANFSQDGAGVMLSISFALQGNRRVEVYCKDKQFKFNAYGKKSDFFLPITDLEEVGIAVFADDILVCKAGKEKEVEKLQSIKNDESEENKDKKEEEIETQIEENNKEYNDYEIAQNNYFPQSIKMQRLNGEVDVVRLSAKIYDYAENNQEGLFNCVINRREKPSAPFGVDMLSQSEVASTVLPNKSNFKRVACYYEQIKDQIDELFEKGERQRDIENLMPESRWVKIVKNRTQYYVVGLIGAKNGIPDYICYGLPSTFAFIPPTSLGNDARWLPLDVKNPQSKGYWILFQSARTGETIKND